MISDTGYEIIQSIVNYFFPFIIVTSATLVLYSNLDKKLCLMQDSNIEVMSNEEINFQLEVDKSLRGVRVYKYAIVNVAYVLFLLLSFLFIVFLLVDVLDKIPKAMRIMSFIASVSNWTFIAIVLSQIIVVYERLHLNIHKLK